MTISEAIEKFLFGYFGTSGRSSKTQAAYTIDLLQLRDFIGPEKVLMSVGAELLEAWAMHMQSKPYAIASIRRKFAAARVFFSYWVRRGVLSSSPMWNLRLSLGKEQVLPRSLSPSDTQLLIEHVWRGRKEASSVSLILPDANFRKVRNIAMIETLFATGIRVGEMVKLKLSDWREEETCFLIRGKGSRERLAFLPDDRSLKALMMYLGHREKMMVTTTALFLNAAGRGISEQGIAKILTRVAQDARISRKVTPHMIRHTVATLLLRYGADLRIVQEVLGHASITTTQRYVHVAKDHLLSTLRTRHPNHHLKIRLRDEDAIAT